MKSKACNGQEHIVEKFSAQSSKNAKYAKSIIKKREISELKPGEGASNMDAVSNAGGNTNVTVTSQNDNTNEKPNIQ